MTHYKQGKRTTYSSSEKNEESFWQKRKPEKKTDASSSTPFEQHSDEKQRELGLVKDIYERLLKEKNVK